MSSTFFAREIRNDLKKNGYRVWSQLVSECVLPHQIDYLDNPTDRFNGSIQLARFSEDSLMARLLCNNGQTVQPAASRIHPKEDTCFLLCLQIDGTANLIRDHSFSTLEKGNWTLCDCSEPYSWLFPEHHGQLVLKIPRQELSRRLSFPEAVSGRIFDNKSGTRKILWDFIHSVWGEMESSRKTIDHHFNSLIIEILSRVLNEHVQPEHNLSRNNSILLLEAKALIDEQISNPNLCADYVANALGISPRYLFFLFQHEADSFGQYVRKFRLEKCRADLLDPSLICHSITEIAFNWGFNNFSHFSRLFKSHFKISPQAFRKSAHHLI